VRNLLILILVFLAARAGAATLAQQLLAKSYSHESSLIFDAPLTTSLLARKPSLLAPTTASRALSAYVPDHSGQLKLAKSGEIRFYGARRVENLVPTADISSATWAQASIVTAEQGGYKIQKTGSNDRRTVAFTVNQKTSSFSVRLRYIDTISGTSNVNTNILLYNETKAANLGVKTINLTGPGVYGASWTGLTNVDAGDAIRFYIYVLTGGGASEGDWIIVADPQVESTMGHSVPEQCAEYVSTGVLSSPYHGANVDGVRYFSTNNGTTRTATSGTAGTYKITDGIGSDISTITLMGLLKEQGQTNLALRSDAIDNASWTKNNTTITADATTAPDGATIADKLVETASTATHNAEQSVTKAASALAYSFSVYGKQAEKTKLRLYIDDGAGNGAHADCDLANGTIGSASGDGTPFTSLGTGVHAEFNGWYRCVLQGTSNTATTIRVRATILDAGGNEVYLGATSDGIYLWGAQLEAYVGATGAAAAYSSYIPTTSSSVARPRDAVAFGPETIKPEGTMLLEVYNINWPVGATPLIISTTENSGNLRWSYRMFASGSGTPQTLAGTGTVNSSNNFLTPTLYTTSRVAFTWGGKGIVGSTINGQDPTGSTSPAAPSQVIAGITSNGTASLTLNGNFLDGGSFAISRLCIFGKQAPPAILKTLATKGWSGCNLK
jgi:hypothetical protein